MPEDIQGLEALKDKFNQLPFAIRRKVLVNSVKKGGLLIQALMANKVPIRTGLGASQIMMRIDESSPGSVTVDIGPSTKAWYLKFIEYGAGPHDIRMKDGGVIHHPGTKAHPFMRPAWDEGGTEAGELVLDEIAYQIGSLDL